MREEIEVEIVSVENDTRPWWKDRYIALAPGWWIVAISSGVIALLSALPNL